MSESNYATEAPAAEHPAAETPAGVPWPALSPESRPGSSPGRTAADADAAINAILTRLEALPELAVSDHLDVYTRLHDDLRDALNEDVAAHPTDGEDASR